MGRLTLNGFYKYDPFLFQNVVVPDNMEKDVMIRYIIKYSGQLYPWHQSLPDLKQNIADWFAVNEFNFHQMMEATLKLYNPIENYDRYEDIVETPNITNKTEKRGNDLTEDEHDYTNAHTGKDTVEMEHRGTDTVTSEHTGEDSVTSEHTGDDTATMQKRGTDTTTGESTGDGSNSVAAYNVSSASLRDTQHTHAEDGTTITYNSDTTNTTEYGSTTTDTSEYGSTTTDTTAFNSDNTNTTTFASSTEDSGDGSSKITYNSDITATETGTRRHEAHIHGNIGVVDSATMVLNELRMRAQVDIYKRVAMMFENEFMMQLY